MKRIFSTMICLLLCFALLPQGMLATAEGIPLDEFTYDDYREMLGKSSLLALSDAPMLLGAYATDPSNDLQSYSWSTANANPEEELVIGGSDRTVKITLDGTKAKKNLSLDRYDNVTGFESDTTSCSFTVSKDVSIGTVYKVSGEFGGGCGVKRTFTITVTKSFKITFNSDGKSASGMPADFYTNGADVNTKIATDNLPENIPTVAGYGFLGWKKGSEEKIYLINESFSVNADTEFTAVWKETRSITYQTGSEEEIPSVDVIVNEEYIIDATTPSDWTNQNGNIMRFDCWKIGERIYRPSDKITVIDNMNFVAQWNECLTLTYDTGNSATSVAKQTVFKDVSHAITNVVPDAYESEGKRMVFDHWEASDGSHYAPGEYITLQASATLTAKYVEKQKCTVTFVNNSGNVLYKGESKGGMFEVQVDYGGTIRLPKAQRDEGSDYLGEKNIYIGSELFTFRNWLNEDGTNAYGTDGNIVITSDRIFSALYIGDGSTSTDGITYFANLPEDAVSGPYSDAQCTAEIKLLPTVNVSGNNLSTALTVNEVYYYKTQTDDVKALVYNGWEVVGKTSINGNGFPVWTEAWQAAPGTRQNISTGKDYFARAVWSVLQTYTISFDSYGGTPFANRTLRWYDSDNLPTGENGGVLLPVPTRNYTVKYSMNGAEEQPESTCTATFLGWRDRDSFTYNGRSYGTDVLQTAYYANAYGDLYKTFGYNRYGLVQHYENYGRGENRSGTSPNGENNYYIPDRYVMNLGVPNTTSKLIAVWQMNGITLPEPTLEGYTFEGWYADAEFVNKVGVESTEGVVYVPDVNDTDNEITLYANWKQNVVNVDLTENEFSIQTSFVENAPGTLTIDLGDYLTEEELKQFKDKALYILEVTPNENVVLKGHGEFTTGKEAWGSESANKTFALTTSSGTDVAAGVQVIGSLTDKVTFRLYNANAITDTATERSVTITLANEYPVDPTSTSTVTLTIKIVRTAASINVSVPLYLVMSTNLDGGSADVPAEYVITNNSDTHLTLESVTVTDEDSELLKGVEGDPGCDEYRINKKADCVNKNLIKGGTYNPLENVEVGPLSFVTADGKYVKFSTITYVVSIPTEDIE